MFVTIQEFWKLITDSQLVSTIQAEKLNSQFLQVKGAATQGNAGTLCEWLIAEKVLTRYQGRILLAGRSGPFVYGDYRLDDRIEKGRLAEFFHAVHLPTGYRTLLQFCAGRSSGTDLEWDSTTRRVQSLETSSNLNLWRCFECVDLGSYRFLVYDHPVGQCLAEVLQQNGPIDPETACCLLRQVAQAVVHVHAQGLVVSDLRPSSIWFQAQPVPDTKLFFDSLNLLQPVDFKTADTEGATTAGDDCHAPELRQTGRLPDRVSDIYALGCTFYQVLVGCTPRLKSAQQTVDPILSLESAGVPDRVAEIVARMLAENPEVRFQDANAVVQAITPFVPHQLLDQSEESQSTEMGAYVESLQHRRDTPTAGVKRSRSELPGQPLKTELEPPSMARSKPLQSGKINVAAQVQAGPERQAGLADQTSMTSSVLDRIEKQDGRGPGRGLYLAGGLLAFIVCWAIFYLFRGSTQDTASSNNRPQSHESSARNSNWSGEDGTVNVDPTRQAVDQRSEADRAEEFVMVEDDGKLLWAPPTLGSPIDFRYVAPDGQLFLIVRPCDLLSDDEGIRILQSLGPDFESLLQFWEGSTGLKIDQVKQMIVSFHPDRSTHPRVMVVARLVTPLSPKILATWGEAEVAAKEMGSIFRVAGWNILVPKDGDQRVLVMGEESDVREVVSSEGLEPLLRREIEQVLRSTDRQRHVTVLAAPNFFFAGGQGLFSGPRKKLLAPMSRFLGDDLQAALFSCHVSDMFYWEARFVGQLDHSEVQLSEFFRSRIDEIPIQVAGYLGSISAPNYWRKLASRFPLMFAEWRQSARVGCERNQVVINGYLPRSAAHNLFLGGELALASTPGVTTSDALTAAPSALKTVQDVLENLYLDLDLLQQSLEFAVRDLSTEINDGQTGPQFEFRIKIAGADLEADGITRNQQIRGFHVQQKSVAETLTALLMKANPTAVSDPSSPEQKLVWVVNQGATGPDVFQGVLVTTRRAAEKKGYDLPSPFRLK